MGKMSELALTIDEIRACAAKLTDIADSLAEMYSGQAEPETPKPEAPKKKLDLVTVRTKLGEISRAGYTEQVRVLLGKYGAQKLSEVDPANYEVLLADAEDIDHATD